MARPSKLTPKMVENIYFLTKKGLTEAEVCQVVGINTETLNRWKNSKGFSNALKACKADVDDQVENALLRRALGYEYDELVYEKSKTGALSLKMKKNEEGDLDVTGFGHTDSYLVKIVKKQVLPDVTAQIFWLKNRRKDRWREKDSEEAGKGGDTHYHLTFVSPAPKPDQAVEPNRISELVL